MCLQLLECLCVCICIDRCRTFFFSSCQRRREEKDFRIFNQIFPSWSLCLLRDRYEKLCHILYLLRLHMAGHPEGQTILDPVDWMDFSHWRREHGNRDINSTILIHWNRFYFNRSEKWFKNHLLFQAIVYFGFWDMDVSFVLSFYHKFQILMLCMLWLSLRSLTFSTLLFTICRVAHTHHNEIKFISFHLRKTSILQYSVIYQRENITICS